MAHDAAGASENERVLSAYLEGRISVVEAVTYFVGLTDESNWPGIGVDLQSVDDETRIRAEELFRRIAWCKFTSADPAAEPEYSFDDMLRALGRAGHIDPESSV